MIHISIIIGFTYIFSLYNLKVLIPAAKMFDITVSNYIISYFLSLTMGVLIGIEKFFGEIKKAGHWRINYYRILILGLPALIFSTNKLLYYVPVKVLLPLNFNIFIQFFRFFLGYIIITSIEKVER